MTDLMDSPLLAPLADLLTPDKVETLQEMARVFYSNRWHIGDSPALLVHTSLKLRDNLIPNQLRKDWGLNSQVSPTHLLGNLTRRLSTLNQIQTLFCEKGYLFSANRMCCSLDIYYKTDIITTVRSSHRTA